MTNPFGQSPLGGGPDVMKDMLQRSQSAMQELNVATRHSLEAMAVSVQTAQRGAEAVRAQTLSYCQQVAQDASAAAHAIASAKTPVEAFQVQADYSRKWFEGYMTALREISTAMGASVQATVAATQNAMPSGTKPLGERPAHPEGGVES
ncbi:MAG: phasin family protein [Phenylobacterium sp.]|uniref:phasin family protein n=1 Tax=Phenylobacterium sp. TaxID=1871053 RepID=UPI0027330BF7|nr:phasin family protein [Phenylobacterium sp.]MDP3172891.1 phasin family protein [Phenylobacterium sp.]